MSDNAKTVFISGAAQRIGRAIAFDLAHHGWKVVVHYNRSKDAAQAVVDEINESAGAASPVAFCVGGDLRDESQTATLISKACDLAGQIDCVINNASAFEPDDIISGTRDSWDLHLEVNLRAPTVLIRDFVNQLPDGADGNVINIIDQRVWRLTPKFMSYTVSKSALWTLTQTLAQALAPSIRVNAIGPGPTLQNKRQSEEGFEKQASLVPLQRQTELTEICDGVRYILSARAMTGQMIALDGGQHLAWETPDVTQAGE